MHAKKQKKILAMPMKLLAFQLRWSAFGTLQPRPVKRVSKYSGIRDIRKEIEGYKTALLKEASMFQRAEGRSASEPRPEAGGL